MRREDWDQFETDQQTIVDQIRESGPEWDVLAVDLADQSDEVLFLLVIRRRVSDEGNMILSERYYRYDLDAREGSYLSNGIERRLTGSMAAALRVLYAATTNGDVDPDDPMLMDSRGDGLNYHPEELTDPLGELLDDDLNGDAETLSTSDEPDREGWVRCRRCDEAIHKDEAIQFGKGDLGEFWIHEGACPDPDNDDEEGDR